ncbi:MAG TPA: hypothetical protein PK390_02765 [Fervidobacterium nodosum]|nr:hypothetical protein [Fervidobacterium nodosum]
MEKREQTQKQRPPRPMGPGAGGPAFARGGEKPKDFKKALKKLMTYLRPHQYAIIAVFVITIIATVLTIKAPKILGEATTEIFRVIMLRKTPFSGFLNTSMDFDKIFRILLNVALLYGISALLNFSQGYMMAGITQKIVKKMREDINDKLKRLPPKFLRPQVTR